MARSALTQAVLVSLAICSLILVAACESEEPAERSIETIADEVLAAMLERNPAMATSFAIKGA